MIRRPGHDNPVRLGRWGRGSRGKHRIPVDGQERTAKNHAFVEKVAELNVRKTVTAIRAPWPRKAPLIGSVVTTAVVAAKVQDATTVATAGRERFAGASSLEVGNGRQMG